MNETTTEIFHLFFCHVIIYCLCFQIYKEERERSFFYGKEVLLMLHLSHLTIKDRFEHPLIEDFSFTLGAQDKVAIIGEEGNGKSTLCKALVDPNLISSYTSISGTIDMDFTAVGYLSQQFKAEWLNQSCLDYLLKQQVEDEIPLEAYNECGKLQMLCANLGINQDLILSEQPIATLSGGEKVKLQLLKLVYQTCDLYILDEPTNDLDIATLTWLEHFIQTRTVPVLFISHDETLLKACANRILHLEQRNKKTKAVINDFRGSYEEYCAQRYAKREKEVQLANQEKLEYRKKKERLNDMMNAVHDAQNAVSRQNPHKAKMLKKKMHTVKAVERRFALEQPKGVDSLEEGIDVFFDAVHGIATKVILEHELCIQVEQRVLIHRQKYCAYGKDKIAIIGKNGCGKTQLMKQFYTILHARKDIKIGYMPQNYMELMDPEMSAFAFLAQKQDKEDITRSRELLGRMKFTPDEMIHPIKELSEGQKAKLYLLKFIKDGCNVLLLDEPTRNLSPLSAPLIRHILQEYDGCIIMVSHDRMLIQEVSTKLWEIEAHQVHVRSNDE